MTAKQAEKRFKKGGKTKSVSAVSPVISTIIISSTLLIILVIASFVSTNILELQLANTEFEQAKTSMLLLDKIIQDVALREGAISSIQFSQRSGGIGIYESTEIINITDSQGNNLYPFDPNDAFYVIKYRGGSRVSAAETNLTGSSSLVVSMSDSLGYVRVKTGNGVWIVLDYLRVRVVTNTILRVGDTEYNLTDIFIIRLELGSASGSGTVTVKVQNMGFTTTTQTYYLTNDVTLYIRVGDRSTELALSGSLTPVVRVTEALIRVSIS